MRQIVVLGLAIVYFGVQLCVGQTYTYTISGGPSPSEKIWVDDDVTITVGGRTVLNDNDRHHNGDQWGSLYPSHSPVSFTAEPRELVHIVATNHTMNAGLSPIWAHVSGAPAQKLFDGYQHGSGPNGVFVNVTVNLANLALSPPTNVTATRELEDRIDVSWDAVAGATEYEVWVSTDRNSFTGSTLKHTVSGTSISDNAIAAYYYIVAKNSSETSDPSFPAFGAQSDFVDNVLLVAAQLIKVTLCLAGEVSSCDPGITDLVHHYLHDIGILPNSFYLPGFAIATASPVDIEIVLPSGSTLTKENAHNFGAFYIEGDILGDGNIRDYVLFAKPLGGQYVVNILPAPGSEGETFSMYYGDASGVTLAYDDETIQLGADYSSSVSHPQPDFSEFFSSMHLTRPNSNALKLCFPTWPGHVFQVLKSEDLQRWEAVGEPVVGDGLEKCQSVHGLTGPTRGFFRIEYR